MKKLLILSLALTGCATVPTFPEPDASWTMSSGQLQYVTAERSVIGEFTAWKRANDFRLEFTKGGAFTLLRVDRHGMHARADGPLARGRWTGNVSAAPPRVRSWVNQVFTAFGGMESIQGAALTAAARADRRMAGRIEILGAQPGERFVFVFNR